MEAQSYVKMNTEIMLNNLPKGSRSIIKELTNQGSIRRRLLDLGFVKGSYVTCIGAGPSGDPIAFMIKGTIIALRKEDAQHVIVTMEQIQMEEV